LEQVLVYITRQGFKWTAIISSFSLIASSRMSPFTEAKHWILYVRQIGPFVVSRGTDGADIAGIFCYKYALGTFVY
jgi:hypothetical protein